MNKNTRYEVLNPDNGLNENANMFEHNVGCLDYDACLMSQRMAVTDNPSGLIKLKELNFKDH